MLQLLGICQLTIKGADKQINMVEKLLDKPKSLPGPTGEDNSFRYESRGVIVSISPWNFPLAIFLGGVTSSLACGNCVIAKPAEQTPKIAKFAIDLCYEAEVWAKMALVPIFFEQN